MGVLQRFERRLGGLVEGIFARAFKSEVQPVEVAAALQRELRQISTAMRSGCGQFERPSDQRHSPAHVAHALQR